MIRTVYLVRHGHHSLLDRVLCGRMDGVPLARLGVAQSEKIALELEHQGIERVQSSPRLRAQQTAAVLADRVKLPVETVWAVDELDVGEWMGQRFDALAMDHRWQRWNNHRATSRPPAGESMVELQARVVAHLDSLRDEGASSTVIVSHAEPIRAAVMHYRDMDLDRFAEIAIDPSSISIVRFNNGAVETQVNRRVLP